MQEKICFQIDLVEVVQNPNPKVSWETADGEFIDGMGLELCGPTVETSRPHEFLGKYLIFCFLNEF